MSSECLLLIAHYIRAIDLTFDKNDSILRRTMDAFLSGIPLKELDWKGSAGILNFFGNLSTITRMCSRASRICHQHRLAGRTRTTLCRPYEKKFSQQNE